MDGRGVIVESFVPDQSGKNGNGSAETLSCSGLYLGNGLILTHGTVVSDFLRHPASQSVLLALDSNVWVSVRSTQVGGNHNSRAGSESRNSSTITLDNNISDIGNPIHERYSLKTAIDVTQARFNVILPVSSTTQTRRELTDSYTESKTTPNLSNVQSIVPSAARETQQMPVSEGSEQPSLSPSYNTCPAYLERLFVLPGLREKVEGLMPASEDWKFTEEETDKEAKRNYRLQNLVLSTFVILSVGSDRARAYRAASDGEVAEAVRRVLARSSPAGKGATVYVESSPFGSLSPGVFLNSLSRGVVSNTVFPLLLTDARCILGTEGAPVFVTSTGGPRLCGLVISPFCWRGGEWLGLTLLAAIHPILRSILLSCSQSGKAVPHVPVKAEIDAPKTREEINAQRGRAENNEPKTMLLEDPRWYEDRDDAMARLTKYVEESVVGVWGGSGWGSGIVVSSQPTLVLTAAHVTQPAHNGVVKVVLNNGSTVSGRVLHQTQPASPGVGGAATGKGTMWDLAVVGDFTQPLTSRPLTLAPYTPQPGNEVMLVGYGVFSPSHLPSPSFSRGVVSKVVTTPPSSLTWPSPFTLSNSLHNSLPHTLPHPLPRLLPQSLPHPDSHFPHYPSHDPHELMPGHALRSSCGCSSQRPAASSGILSERKGLMDTSGEQLGQNISYKHTKIEAEASRNCGYNEAALSSINKPLSCSNHHSKQDEQINETRQQEKHESVAVLMQTTCSVYAGSSGGPLVALHPTRGPEVVGVVVCNTRDTANKATFPHINLAVPTPLVRSIIAAYVAEQDPCVLGLLDVMCPAASRLWSLGALPQSAL